MSGLLLFCVVAALAVICIAMLRSQMREKRLEDEKLLKAKKKKRIQR